MLVLLLIGVLGTFVLSLPIVQTSFARYAADTINTDFGTHISIDKLRISLISWDTNLKGVFIEDYQKDTLFYINDLTTSILSVRNLLKGQLEFGDIGIDELKFKLKTYQGTTDTNLQHFIDKLDNGRPRNPDSPPFFLSSSHIEIASSIFKLIDENRENEEMLNFSDLNINADDFRISGPEVTVDIEAMSFMSDRGIRVEKMATEFQVHPAADAARFFAYQHAGVVSKRKSCLRL